jgi:photosystem II stability/assembly factor-like uncharacterized protein
MLDFYTTRRRRLVDLTAEIRHLFEFALLPRRRFLPLTGLLLLVVFLLSANAVSAQSWKLVSPLPTANPIYDIQFVDDDLVFAVGYNSQFLKSTDGGLNWSISTVSAAAGASLLQVGFVNSSVGYVTIQGEPGILKTTDGGQTWSSANGGVFGISGPASYNRALSLQVLDANNVFVLAPYNAYRTTNGGTSWTNINPFTSPSQLRDVFFFNSNDGYILDANGMYVTDDGGVSWDQLTDYVGTRGSKLFFLDTNNGWVLQNTNSTVSNGVHVTTDGGTTWNEYTFTGGYFTAKDFVFTSTSSGKILDGNKILITSDGGQNWTIDGYVSSDYTAMSLNQSKDKFILAGANGSIGWYDAGGNHTTISNGIVDGYVYDILFQDLSNGYVLDQSKILKTTNGGASWTSFDLSPFFTSYEYRDVDFPTATVGYMVGNENKVLKTTNGGLSWAESTAIGTGGHYFQQVRFVSANTGWAIGSASEIYKTTNGGTSWTAQTAPTASVYLRTAFFLDANNGYVAGGNGSIFKTSNGGTNWISVDLPEEHAIYGLYFLNSSTGWVATESRVWYTLDGGTTWTAGAFPYYVNTYEVEFLDANTGFASASGGIVFKTTDGGLNWSYDTEGLTAQGYTQLEVIDIDNMWTGGSIVLANKSGGAFTPAIGVAMPGESFCLYDKFVATFSSNTSFSGGNTFTLQMSDKFGAFASPTNIGSLTTTNASGNILGTIPDELPVSSNYRFRVVSSSPAIMGDDNGADIGIGSPAMPEAFISSSDQVCQGSNAVAYSVPVVDGATYHWSYSGTGATIIGTSASVTINFSLSATSGTLSVSMENECGEGAPLELDIVVYPKSVGGSATGGGAICQGSVGPQLSVTGYTGTIVKWEKSVSPFTTWTEISESASSALEPGVVNETTRYQAIVKSGVCSQATSAYTTVTVSPVSAGGLVAAVSGITEVVFGTSPGNLSLSGHTGAVVRWEKAEAPFTSYSTIAHTSTSYNPGALTSTTRFRAVVKSGECSEATSDYVEIVIVDGSAPIALSFSPADNSTEVALNVTFQVTFSENVQKGTGAVLIKRVSDHSVIESIDITSEAVTISGAVMTITTLADLPPAVAMYVNIEGTALRDFSDNAYAGFANATSWNFTTAKGEQTISFEALPAKVFGEASFPLTATSSSELVVAYSSSNESVAMVVGNIVTITGAGTAVITATQAGDDQYSEAEPVHQTFTVSKASQTITFEPIGNQELSTGSIMLAATASSGLTVSYEITGPAILNGTTLTFTGAGDITVTASQAGNVNYMAAVALPRTFTVTDDTPVDPVKQDQLITFEAIADKIFGDTAFDLEASASSGLEVSFVVAEGPATIEGSTVSITGAGMVTIKADQAGNDAFNAAADVTRAFVVHKAAATITLSDLEQTANGAPKTPAVATSPAGLEAVFTFDGAAIIPVEPGSYQVTAIINDANYEGSVDAVFVLVSPIETGLKVFETSLRIYPNPTADYLRIDGQVHRVAFYDLGGKMVLEENQSATGDWLLDLRTFPKGTYLLYLFGDNGEGQMKRIVKQ